jgi:S-adenosylmethionine hydrolase
MSTRGDGGAGAGGILTLTTDFGPDGPYVAAMKGVVLGLAPGTQIVDVSHRIAPQNILEGAFVLASIVEAFPAGTVHLAVIDPGGGTDRPLVAVSVAGQWVVAPDNGLVGGVAARHEPEGIWEIANPALRRASVSNTFHGRDILAPAAGHLLRGLDPDLLGPSRSGVVRLANFDPRPDGRGLVGEVIFRDAFGNLVTNVRADRLGAGAPAEWVVEIAGERIEGLSRTYAERPSGSLVAVVGSSGWVEVAMVNGDAARAIVAGPGTTVWFRRREARPAGRPMPLAAMN